MAYLTQKQYERRAENTAIRMENNKQISSLIEKHQLCIEILEGIKHFENKKKHRIESIEGFAGTFPRLRRKYLNDVDTINRCIKRLEQRYKRILNDC